MRRKDQRRRYAHGEGKAIRHQSGIRHASAVHVHFSRRCPSQQTSCHTGTSSTGGAFSQTSMCASISTAEYTYTFSRRCLKKPPATPAQAAQAALAHKHRCVHNTGRKKHIESAPSCECKRHSAQRLFAVHVWNALHDGETLKSPPAIMDVVSHIAPSMSTALSLGKV